MDRIKRPEKGIKNDFFGNGSSGSQLHPVSADLKSSQGFLFYDIPRTVIGLAKSGVTTDNISGLKTAKEHFCVLIFILVVLFPAFRNRECDLIKVLNDLQLFDFPFRYAGRTPGLPPAGPGSPVLPLQPAAVQSCQYALFYLWLFAILHLLSHLLLLLLFISALPPAVPLQPLLLGAPV